MCKLYIVPTPIGNLEDFTFRAIKVLKEVDLILAEDTRVSNKLLRHYEISTRSESYHQHNEHKVYQRYVQRILDGEDIALVTDAGTPGISDPGFLISRECVNKGVEIVCLPGATAFVPALVASGFPCDRFVFEGFLPHKKGRQTIIKSLIDREYTSVFYESPHRLVKTLTLMNEILGDGYRACVCREISKIYEEYKRGSFIELIEYYTEKPPKGEIVLLVKRISD